MSKKVKLCRDSWKFTRNQILEQLKCHMSLCWYVNVCIYINISYIYSYMFILTWNISNNITHYCIRSIYIANMQYKPTNNILYRGLQYCTWCQHGSRAEQWQQTSTQINWKTVLSHGKGQRQVITRQSYQRLDGASWKEMASRKWTKGI